MSRVDAELTAAHERGASHERALGRARRRAGGVFYTPEAMATALVEEALGRALASLPPGRPVRIVDPSCGAGGLLAAAYRALLAWHETCRKGQLDAAGRKAILRESIFGVDVDGEAVALTREALMRLADETGDPGALADNIKHGDALLGADAPAELGAPFVWAEQFSQVFAAGGFTVVLGNPPFVDAEAMTRHHPGLRRYCAGRYRVARGNWDLFCVFIELGLSLCAADGWCAMIVPNKLGSADYAAAARELLAREAAVVAVHDHSAAPGFAAGVYPLAFVARRGAAPGPVIVRRAGTSEHVVEDMLSGTCPGGPWPIFGRAGRSGVAARLQAVGRPLGELAEVWGAATVSEAYAIGTLIHDGEPGLRVVNSGTIDRWRARWGEVPLRYLGRRLLRPVIADDDLDQLPPRRLQQARRPKLIVAGMTRVLEGMLDVRGEYLAGKSTTICWWPADLRLLLALLHSRVVDDYYQEVHGGDRLARGYLRIGPPQLRRIPVPDPRDCDAGDLAAIAALVDAMIAGEAVVDELDDRVAALYGWTG